jgi:vacuolar-type H+-ATPase subunit C/Vma6
MYYSADFTTASARSLALSDRLLSLSQVERMLSAENAAEAFRILHDISWGAATEDSQKSEDYEAMLRNGLYEVKATITEASPSETLSMFLFLPFDLQNAKIALNAHRKQLDYDSIRGGLSNLSYFSRRKAYDALQGEQYHFSYDFLANALKAAAKLLETDPQAILQAERILDVAVHKRMASLALELSNPLLGDFFRGQIDIENIKTLLRLPKGEDEVFFLSPLTAAGYEMLDKETALGRLEFSVLKPFLQKGMQQGAESKTLIQSIELSMEASHVNSLFWATKIEPFGADSLVLLFYTKLRNAEIIRTILVGKRSGFSNEVIREMIAPYLPFLPER